MHVVATAGHVDHGKSTLVRALTGTDPDRLAEEKERGLTIDLGFASMPLPSGRQIAFIDVPGHVRFLKNMLAGVSGVDACVFVVDVTEGWKPQSEEHLRILQLLGLGHGLVALTKTDEADDDLVELARLDVAEHVAGTFLADAPIVATDAVTSTGIDALVEALDGVLAQTPTAADRSRPRLWVDRAFAIKGSGTVVTGTLTGGALTADDTLTLLPAGRGVRVRALQSLYRQCDRIGPGNRVAVNLVGAGHRDVDRGDAVVRAEQWHATDTLDAELSVLASLDHPVTRRGAYAAYIGSGEHPVRLRVLGPAAIEPGRTGLVRLHLPLRLPLCMGDRFILRESGRSETVGGGEVLDVEPVLPASRARPDRSVDRIIAERGRIDAARLERMTGTARPADLGRWAVAPEHLEQTGRRLAEAVAAAGPLGLDLATLDDFERAVIDTLEGVDLVEGRARPAGGGDPLADHPFVKAAEAAPFAPPAPDGVGGDELRLLVRQGRLVESSGIHFGADAVTEAARVVARLLAGKPEGVTVAEVRDAWGTTRKYALALLARLDGTGVTRRRGDLRIAGSRLPQV
ncbi:MAG: selenocysteine-specific translation elongation factor [Acidimicrobiaceae bacterium]|nr:selenocysteine-specific translation elongation factor [Acidimicrobiaceae bacterium]